MLDIFQTLAHVKTIRLKTNMRALLSNDRMSEDVPKGLLLVEERGTPVNNGDCLNLSLISNLMQSVKELKTKVFPNINKYYQNHLWLSGRAISATKNITVNSIKF